MFILIIPSLAVLWWLSFLSVRSIGEQDSFQLGLVAGLFYFLLIPLSLSAFIDIPLSDLKLAPFSIYEDIDVFIYIFLCTLSLGACVVFYRYLSPSKTSATSYELPGVKFEFYLLLTIALTVSFFFLKGKHLGGHWVESAAQAFDNSTIAVLIGNFSNCMRACIFGIGLYYFKENIISKRKLYIYMSVFTLIDLMLSFNRIIVLFFLLMVFIVERRKLRLVATAVLFLPVAAYASHVWPIFRGLALRDGYNIDSMLNAVNIAITTRINEGGGVVDGIYSLFEAGNIHVLKFVVRDFGLNSDYLMGETVFLRSVAFVIPSTIWPDKPMGFGPRLGEMIQGVDILSLNSTLYGEIFANFSWYSPIFIFFLLLLCVKINNVISLWVPQYRFCGIFIAFAAWRFDISFIFISFFVLFLIELLRRFVTPISYRVKLRGSGVRSVSIPQQTSFHVSRSWRR